MVRPPGGDDHGRSVAGVFRHGSVRRVARRTGLRQGVGRGQPRGGQVAAYRGGVQPVTWVNRRAVGIGDMPREGGEVDAEVDEANDGVA